MKNSLLNANCWGTETQQLLLKAALLPDKLAVDAWREWCELAGADFDNIDYASYTILPLVSRNIGGLITDDLLLERCKGIYRHNWSRNHLLWRKSLPTLQQLKSSGLDRIVLLKGMAMIANYYRDFGVRVIGDIDIFIPKEQVQTAINTLFENGWTTNVSRFDPHILAWHATAFNLDAETILDLHWSILFESEQGIDKKILQDAKQITLTQLSLYVPDPADLLFQTCVHGIKSSPVSLIRWVCDAITILNQEKTSIDWGRVITFAHQAKVCTSLNAAFTYLNTIVKNSVPENVIEQLHEPIPSRLERWENWGKQYDSFIVKSWTRFCMRNGYKSIWQQVIHTPDYLQEAARLRYKWQIPFYAVYWVVKRMCRLAIQ